jgi:hypothetical protein
VPHQLEQKIAEESSDHKKKDSSIPFVFDGVVSGSPRQKNAQKKNGAPDDKLINKRQ